MFDELKLHRGGKTEKSLLFLGARYLSEMEGIWERKKSGAEEDEEAVRGWDRRLARILQEGNQRLLPT